MRLKLIISEITETVKADNTSLYAAQTSFFLIISSVPFLMLIFAAAGLFEEIDAQRIMRVISAYAPAEVSRLAAAVISELTDKSASVPVISVTAASALWLSSRAFTALYTGLASLNSIPRRGYIYTRLISVVYTLAFLAALLLTIVFIGFGGRLEKFFLSRSVILQGAAGILLKGKIVVFFVYLTMIFALFYKFLPKTGMKFLSLLPGACFSSSGWIIFSLAYSVYIEKFSNYTYFYGSLAAVVLLMLWVYVCMNIFLYGAELNKILNFTSNEKNF